MIMLRHLRSGRRINSQSIDSRSGFDCFGLFKKKKRLFKKKKREDRSKPLAATEFYKAAFIPCFFRKAIKDNTLKKLPITVETLVVVMQWKIPALNDLINKYFESEAFVLENLSQEINNFTQPVLELILAQGGDVIKFTDSCWHIMWQVESENSHVISHVVELACYIQTHYKPTKSLHGLQLHSTFGVSVGKIKTLYLGDISKRVLYFHIGDVISECAAAVILCEKGKVVLSPTAWNNMKETQDQYHAETLRDGFIQLSRIGPSLIMSTTAKNEEQIELMEYLQDNDLCEKCIHPLTKAATTVQQLELLSSTSHVSVGAVFIKNIDLDTLDVLQSATLIILDCITQYEGLLTKIVYKQGVFYGILLGYLGFKHDDDAVRSLYFSNDVVRALNDVGISAVVRFATGTCFSGVLGGFDRMEPIVAGKAVSSAVRLCEHFPDIPIVCCINTFLQTRRVLGDIFTHVKQRSRGLINIPVCFEVNFSRRAPDVEVECFGREIEKDLMTQSLSKLLNGEHIAENCLPLIIVSGVLGMGKTNFLKWTLLQAETLGFKLKCGICKFFFEEHFERAWYIAKSILVSGVFDSECKIINLLGANANKYPLHLLNQYLNTEFPAEITHEKSQELQKDMLVELMRGCANGHPIFIILDDGEQIAVKTWMFLQDLLITGTAVVVVAFVEPFKEFSIQPFLNFILKQKFATVTLGPLEERDIVSLACHYLNIVAIHKEFVRLLTENCQGNALLLQEILLLPQLQLHMCLVEHNSVVQSTLEESFISIDLDEDVDKSHMKVCDVLDIDGLRSVYVPKALLDVVKERTIGLSPEEQMLIKKCACLGEYFGLYLLEAICPEYTTGNLRASIVKFIHKNILAMGCSHINLEKCVRESIATSEIREEFCEHPLMFTSEVFRECISNSMTKAQKERLHQFIFTLLKETHIVCDSCRNIPGPQILIAHSIFEKDCFIPRLNFIQCQCINFDLSTYTHIDYHLKEGCLEISHRIKYLLKAAELALVSGADYPAENFLQTAQEIVDYSSYVSDKNFSSTLAKAALKCLQAKTTLSLDKTTEAMDSITQALVILGKVFPSDYLNVKKPQKKVIVVPEIEEETRCIIVGCELLLKFGKYRDVYIILKNLGSMYKKLRKSAKHEKFPSFANVLQLKTMLVVAVCKIKPAKVNKRLTDAIEVCNKRLDGDKPVDVIQMKEIIKALRVILIALFESDNLSKATIVGNRVFQIAKIVKSIRDLGKVVTVICLIYYYQKSFNKCFELLSHLLDVFQKTGNVVPEAIYYSIVIKVLRALDNPEVRKDKMIMCTEFAKSKTPDMILTRNKSQKFWIMSLMALWCSEHYLEDAFEVWHESALSIKEECTLTNYWSIAAALNMITINLNQVRETFACASNQMSTVMEEINKNLIDLEDFAVQFAPVVVEKIIDIRMLIQTILMEKVNETM